MKRYIRCESSTDLQPDINLAEKVCKLIPKWIVDPEFYVDGKPAFTLKGDPTIEIFGGWKVYINYRYYDRINKSTYRPDLDVTNYDLEGIKHKFYTGMYASLYLSGIYRGPYAEEYDEVDPKKAKQNKTKLLKS